MATKKKAPKKRVDERKFLQWAKQGEALAKAKDGNQWAIGDWILAGVGTFGRKEAYNRAQDATGMTRATLEQFKYTAESFAISTRVKNLSFGHHRLVADKELTPEERKRLLQYAKSNKESVASFAAFLKARKKDIARRAEKRSHADVAVEGVIEACDAFLRNHHIETILNEPPSLAARTALLERLKKAVAELNSKVEQIAMTWREHDEAETAWAGRRHKAIGVGAGK